MKADKDKKGKFKEGNKAGNRFTSTNQPSKNGRKPSRFKEIIGELDELGESLSLEDFNKVVKSLLTLNKDNLIKIAQDEDTPIAIVIIASAIAGDIENKQLGNLDRLLDRVYGRATQKVESDVTIVPNINITPMSGVKQAFADNESEVDE